MSKLIEDKEGLLQFCRDFEKQNLVIRALLSDHKLKKNVDQLCKNENNISAEEVMHDTILSFIRTVQKPNFQLLEEPRAYLNGIAKNVFLMLLRKESKHNKVDITAQQEKGYSQEYFIHYDRNEIFQQVLNKINDDCKEVLLLWARKFKLSEIADIMNYASDKYAKKKKYLCLKKLIAMIDADPKLKAELKEYV